MDIDGRETGGGLLSGLVVQMQLGAIRVASALPVVTEVVLGLTLGEAMEGAPSLAGAVGAATKAGREMVEEGIEQFSKRGGWTLVCKQTRWNGAGIDLIFRRPGSGGAGRWTYVIVELKVSVRACFAGLLGQAKYGWQMSREWIEHHIGNMASLLKSGLPLPSRIEMYNGFGLDDLRVIAQEIDNPNVVKKALIGAKLELEETDRIIAKVYEMGVEFLDDVVAAGRPLALTKKEEFYMVVKKK